MTYTTVTRKDLQIGDIVRLFGGDGPYMDATVYQVENGNVHVVRPYVHAADFICTSGVITYLGEEKFSLPADNTAIMLLESRPPEATRTAIRGITDAIRMALDKGEIWKARELLRQL